MLEWQVTEEEEMPPLPPQQAPRRRARWLWMGGVALLFLAAIGGVLWQRIRERDELRREDLLTFVKAEEQALRFGLQEEVIDLVAPDVDQAWYSAYHERFEQEEPLPPAEVSLGEVAWDEAQNAVAIVSVDGTPSLRYYQRSGRSWRRAPLENEMWGALRSATLTDDLTLQYFERDHVFASVIVERLPQLLSELDNWEAESLNGELRIVPGEFKPVIRHDGAFLISINSPLMLSPQSGLDPEAQLTLALGSRLFERTRLAIPPENDLPGAARMLDALQAAAAVQWALNQTDQQRLRDEWALIATRDPTSSLLFTPTEGEARIDPLAPTTPSDAELLVLADALYERFGAESVAALARALPGARDWEQLFEEVLGSSFAEWTQGEATAFTLTPPVDVLSTPRPAPEGHMQVLVEGTPLYLRLTESTLTSPDGEALPAACAPLFGQLRLEGGEWIETGYRFQPDALMIREWTLTTPTMRPTRGGHAIFVLRDDEAQERTFLSVDSSGELQPLLTVPPGLTLLPVRGSLFASNQAAMLWTVPGCGYRVLLRYDLIEGRMDSWLLSDEWGEGELRLFAEEQALVVAQRLQGSESSRWVSTRLEEGALGPHSPTVQLPALTEPLGRTADGEWLLFAPSRLGDTIEVYDSNQPSVRRWVTQVEDTPLSDFIYDGTRLYYLTPQTFDATRGATLQLVDPAARTQQSVMWLAPEFMVYVEGAGRGGGAFVSNTGPAGRTERTLVQLLRVDPKNRLELQRSSRQSDDTPIVAARSCYDGATVYMVQEGARRDLYRWPLGSDEVAASQPLWSGEGPLTLWGCAR